MESELQIKTVPPLTENQLWGQEGPAAHNMDVDQYYDWISRCPYGRDCSAWDAGFGCRLNGCDL